MNLSKPHHANFTTLAHATILSVVIICAAVQLSAAVMGRTGLAAQGDMVFVSMVVAAMLAPPSAFAMALYSTKRGELEAELRQLADTDPLTGLSNRRAFEDVFERERARALRSRQPLSILLLDVDHFKQFNTIYGHAGGDLALVSLARLLLDQARTGSDAVGRWGGEEFVIMLAETDLSAAERAAERFRQAIADHVVQTGTDDFSLTVSIGVASCNADETLESVVERADSCLFEAKDLGRNRVVVSRPAQVSSYAA